jgi:hypothetical protein
MTNQNFEEWVADTAAQEWLNKDVTEHRQSKFTAASKRFPRVGAWVANAEYSLKPKRLTVEYYDVSVGEPEVSIDNPIRDLVNSASKYDHNDTYTIVNYDGAGRVLGKVIFNQCKLEEHKTSFAYGNDKHLTHKLTYSFANFKLS